MSPVIELSLIAGLLAIDERAGWQSLLAQPVFAAALAGWAIGEIAPALAVGVLLELIYLSILPMRGMRRPDQVAAAVVGGGSAALIIHMTADPRILFITAIGTLVGLVVGELGARISGPLFDRLNRALGRVDFTGASAAVIERRLGANYLGAIGYIFAVQAVVVYVLLRMSYVLAERFTRLDTPALVTGAVNWELLLPALGAASLIHVYWHRHLKRVLILSAVIVMLVLWLQ